MRPPSMTHRKIIDLYNAVKMLQKLRRNRKDMKQNPNQKKRSDPPIPDVNPPEPTSPNLDVHIFPTISKHVSHAQNLFINKPEIQTLIPKSLSAGSCLHRLRRESTSGTHDTIE
ncbi:hypothetical protein AVEN_205811-1 [Araneus ventricosus]|uniref:Uncharacterized protein n=1 Tax=Araneus ventricosus TaxID=182803 RepID=A0A4Y2JKK5_ARAVE|nr:hypothetical protein AVEN_205811-1 [Araneus ventricosus]